MSSAALALGERPRARAIVRACPEDFVVTEELGFVPDGEGEHAFVYLEKRGLNTADLAQRLSEYSGVPLRDIGYSGLKDRLAVTRQWFSLGLAGRAEPAWQRLEERGDVRVLAHTRHGRKLRRGVHRANRFQLALRNPGGDLVSLSRALERVRDSGVPNYFGEQRFGRGGANLVRARQWAAGGGRRLSRQRRGLFLSSLRAQLFNTVLDARVRAGTWDEVLDGELCILNGTRSQFVCERADAELRQRAASGDIHPGLPLWGRGEPRQGPERLAEQAQALAQERSLCDFLERAGLSLDYRAARSLPDDFSWRFCDDGSLRLEFSLAAGSYATAVLAQLIDYGQGDTPGGDGSE